MYVYGLVTIQVFKTFMLNRVSLELWLMHVFNRLVCRNSCSFFSIFGSSNVVIAFFRC